MFQAKLFRSMDKSNPNPQLSASWRSADPWPVLWCSSSTCWVLSHNTHTANRCYRKKKNHKNEHFSSSPCHKPQAPLGGLPLEKIQPLATRAEAWQAIPGLVSTSVQRSTAHVLRAEVMSLLAKGTLETVSPSQSESESSTAITSSSPRRMVIEDPSSISDI